MNEMRTDTMVDLESLRGKVVVSKGWKEKHEERMKTVGVVRTERGEGKKGEKESGIEEIEELREGLEKSEKSEKSERAERENPRLEEKGMVTSLGDGWGW